MRTILTLLFGSLLLLTGCSNKLDDVVFTDNPYDDDYIGPDVIFIDNIVRDTAYNRNNIYYHVTFPNSDGVRLYKNGTVIATHYNSTTHTIFISDPYASSGYTYTYEVRLYAGGGESPSDPVIYTTP
jgi:hypothetical protein